MNKSIIMIYLGDFFFDARCINMANTIIDAGEELNIIDVGQSEDQYRGKKIYHISLPRSGIYKFIKFYYETKKILTQINPQNIIAGDLYSLPAAVSLKNANIIYDSREIYTQLAGLVNKPMAQLFWSWVERKNIYKTKSVMVTADGDGIILKQLYKNINTVSIYNFPSIKMKPNGKASLSKKLRLSKGTKIFLYQGALHKGRGIKTMIQLLEDFPNSHAVIIGDGPYKNGIREFSKKLNLINRIHLLGKVPYREMFELTMDADIGFSLIRPISQSYKQALPNKIFEYALANVPVIASNLPEMDNIIQKFKLGATVPYNERSKQKKAINKLLIEFKRKNIQKTAEKYLVWEKQKDKLLMCLNIKL